MVYNFWKRVSRWYYQKPITQHESSSTSALIPKSPILVSYEIPHKAPQAFPTHLFDLADRKFDGEIRKQSREVVFAEVEDQVEDRLVLVVLRGLRPADLDLEMKTKF